MNDIRISGRLTRDAETVTRNVGGVATLVTDFTVAAPSGRWVKDENGGHYERTNFFKVTLWREPGAKLAPYLKQGREVSVSGEVYVQAWLGTHGAKPAEAPDEEAPFDADIIPE